MPALADLQADVRRALLSGDASALEGLLVGGSDGRKRLAIHQRHYAASLARALLDRFPATVWLVGSDFVKTAAQLFVRDCPPTRPCIAEYGEEFPAFIAAQPGAHDVPYLGQFAELEWHLGRLSLAVDSPGPTPADLSAFDPAALSEARMALQPGLQLLTSHWAIDELMALYLTDRAPDQFVLQPTEVWLELRGCRGELHMNRLTQPDFVFRAALATGRTLGDAAVSALDVDSAFDPGRALLTVLDEGLVATIEARRKEGVE